MPNLTLRGLSDSTLTTLRRRAATNHRSLNGEILAIIDVFLSYGNSFEDSASSLERDNPVDRQKQAILGAAGGWLDSRSEKEVARDIVSHRTKGREVKL